MGDEWEWKLTIETRRKGGPGSGNFGHAGRPGQVGGSAPGKGGGGGLRPGTASEIGFGADRKAAIFLSDSLPEINSLGNRTIDADGNPVFSGEARPQVKAEVVKSLADRSGLSEGIVNLIVGKWADTAADEDRKALESQAAAARAFGTENTPYVARELASISLASREEGWPLDRSEMESFMKAMYDHTQERLAKAGFKPDDTITLYRGTGMDRDAATAIADGDVLDIRLNPLSSWSSAPNEAAKFASDFWGPSASLLLKMDIPVSMVAGTARTGFGSLPECEYIIIGGNDIAHQARVVKVVMDYDDFQELPPEVRGYNR